jgi:type II secretory pathway pseudopilin PulG
MEFAGIEMTIERVLLILVLVFLVLVLAFLADNTVQQRRTQAAVQQTQVELMKIKQQTQVELKEIKQQTQGALVELKQFKEDVPHREFPAHYCGSDTAPRLPFDELIASPSQNNYLTSTLPFVLPADNVGLSTEMFDKVRAATFAILDSGGHPVCCGFFVSACGVALTAAHEADKWVRKKGKKSMARASTHDNKTFDLEVVERKVGDVDVTVLRLPSAAAAQACLQVPDNTFTEKELSGAPVNLIHGSIAWSAGASPSNFAQDSGSIIKSNATTIHYNVGTFKGHSGAALLLRGQEVIGLHSEGFNDLPQEYSEHSPSTAADAVRLDVPAVRAAVGRYIKVKSA